MRATRTFTDRNGVTHRNGEEWLIKMEDTEAHIPDVYEEVRAKTVSPSLTLSLPLHLPLPDLPISLSIPISLSHLYLTLLCLSLLSLVLSLMLPVPPSLPPY